MTKNQVRVASQGVTKISEMLGGSQVSVEVTTHDHDIDIGKASGALSKKKLTSCTYSRFPCSLVDYVEISVDGNSLFVARSVYADLADVGMASLQQGENGQFALTLRCGDASESYTVEIMFDKSSVKQRELTGNANGQTLQKTTYFASQPLDE